MCDKCLIEWDVEIFVIGKNYKFEQIQKWLDTMNKTFIEWLSDDNSEEDWVYHLSMYPFKKGICIDDQIEDIMYFYKIEDKENNDLKNSDIYKYMGSSLDLWFNWPHNIWELDWFDKNK